MPKVTPSKKTSKSTSKTKKPTRRMPSSLSAVRKTLGRTSELTEIVLKAMEQEMKDISQDDDRWERMFGPRGAIASLYKLIQVLAKLGDQLKQVERMTKEEQAVALPAMSAADLKLLKEWMAQKGQCT
jgi:hypothetical protein